MQQTKIYLKYDGDTKSYQKHQIDAKTLSIALASLADLLYDSNTLINGPESYIDVKAQAGFIEGSFGFEIIIAQEMIGAAKDILPLLGFVGGTLATGSLLRVLQEMAGHEPEDIVIDKKSGKTKIKTAVGEHEASPEVVELLTSKPVREKLDRLINEPLSKEGTTSFQILSSPTAKKPLFDITEKTHTFFKKISNKLQPVDELETVATIEFIRANKESGTSGWRMRHLGEEVAVKVKDEAFIDSLKKPDAPSIFGLKYKVDLFMKTKKRLGQDDLKTYSILKVRSVLR